jgi:predicted O-methyltransferase YrrM
MSLHPVLARLENEPEYLKAHWSLPREDARFLYLLARIGGFQHMLEVGTSVGYSTLHLALAGASVGAHITTIDASSERQVQAVKHLEEAGLASMVTLLTGDALTVLKDLVQAEHRFDFIFLDARKSEYRDYLTQAEVLLIPGGVLLADNTRSHRKQMQDFIDTITQSPVWETSDLETPNGFLLAKKAEG